MRQVVFCCIRLSSGKRRNKSIVLLRKIIIMARLPVVRIDLESTQFRPFSPVDEAMVVGKTLSYTKADFESSFPKLSRRESGGNMYRARRKVYLSNRRSTKDESNVILSTGGPPSPASINESSSNIADTSLDKENMSFIWV